MLENLALISITTAGVIYSVKSFLNFYHYMKFKRGLREISEMFEKMSTVPTEIKKNKKKGK